MAIDEEVRMAPVMMVRCQSGVKVLFIPKKFKRGLMTVPRCPEDLPDLFFEVAGIQVNCWTQTNVNKSLMESLRSRPSQGPRKKPPTKLAKPGAGPTPRDRSKNKIDDKIKKRMSTRYADISSPTHLTGVPPMPNMVVSAVQNSADYSVLEADEDMRDRSVRDDDAKVAGDDRKLLSAEDFDPNACEWEIQYFFRLYIPINCSPKAQIGKFD
jgi:hypothetical protein